jgi:transposase
MEHQIWPLLEQHLAGLASPFKPHCKYQDRDIVRVFYWAVLHDRPTCWACEFKNWPLHARRRPLPPPSQMSRRSRSGSVLDLARRLERAALAPRGLPPLLALMDGKPLPVGAVGKDPQAGYGRVAKGMGARGYRLHLIVASDASILSWRVAPVNRDERAMGRRLLRDAQAQGYVVADANYDDSSLHDICLKKGELWLVTPSRAPRAKGLGHVYQSPGRLHGLEMVRNRLSGFGRGLLWQREAIERFFGQLTSFGGGLSPLPAWVRTHRRVRRWVQAKLIFNRLRMDAHALTCVA